MTAFGGGGTALSLPSLIFVIFWGIPFWVQFWCPLGSKTISFEFRGLFSFSEICYCICKAPDENFLPFKTIYALVSRGARIHIEPEALHPLWNMNKGALRRADLQASFLKGTLMSQVEHGPFFSGTNKLTKLDAARHRAECMTDQEFQELQEGMGFDRVDAKQFEPALDDTVATSDGDNRNVFSNEVPRDIESLLEERAFTIREIFAIDLAMRIGVLRWVYLRWQLLDHPSSMAACKQLWKQIAMTIKEQALTLHVPAQPKYFLTYLSSTTF